jgi:hypothetical protein
MKFVLGLFLLAGLILTSQWGATEEVESSALLLKEECPLKERKQAAYRWERLDRRWVFVGYYCHKR